MTARLMPRSDAAQTLRQFDMKCIPQPERMTPMVDLDGNSAHFMSFLDLTDRVDLTATSCVETLRNNPFDYIIGDPEFHELPARVSETQNDSLKPYLKRDRISATVDQFARDIAKEVNQNTVNFLTTLCVRIHESMERTQRDKGQPLLPDELLKQKIGACRDFTVLFMDASRSVGLPSRFTSGYFYGDQEITDRQLHAWAEVYLPGAGWRGYDPTVGLSVADSHVALASGPTPFLTMPTEGNFRGNDATSSFEFKIQIESLDSLEELLNTESTSSK